MSANAPESQRPAEYAIDSTPELAELAGLDRLPVAEHVAVFEAVHDRLRARLAGEAADGGPA